MATKSNSELQAYIDTYTLLLEQRKLNKPTIHPQTIVKWRGFDTPDLENIRKIEKSKCILTEPTQIAHFDYHNLDLVVIVSSLDENMILLQCMEKREQCESDSDYDSIEIDSGYDSSEIHVSKIRKTYYLTKTDLKNLCAYLKK